MITAQSGSKLALKAPRLTHQFTLYSKLEYYWDITTRIRETKLGDRVALATMAFDPELPEIDTLLRALCSAAERGVHVSLAVDAHIFLGSKRTGPGPLFFHKQLPRHLNKHYARKLATLEQLRASGGNYAITNKPTHLFHPQVVGRSHIKFTIINSRVYIGGCNLDEASNIDLMTGIDDAKTADWLYDFAQKMQCSEGLSFARGHDTEFRINAQTDLLIDAGKRNQSIIYDKALALIDTAQKDIIITCQYTPNSTTLRHLTQAQKRGVKVRIIYNHPGKHLPPFNLLYRGVTMRERLRTPHALFAGRLDKQLPYLHAKLLVTDRGVMLGSHNYVAAGVKFGTAEIALYSRNPVVGAYALASLVEQIEANQSKK